RHGAVQTVCPRRQPRRLDPYNGRRGGYHSFWPGYRPPGTAWQQLRAHDSAVGELVGLDASPGEAHGHRYREGFRGGQDGALYRQVGRGCEVRWRQGTHTPGAFGRSTGNHVRLRLLVVRSAYG